MKLNQIKILVTRPTHQAEHLCQLIEAEGGQPIRLPVIEIVEIEDRTALLNCRTHLDELDIVIFISANAVEKSLPTLLSSNHSENELQNEKSPLPPLFQSGEQIIAVGKRTASALKSWGLTALCPESPFNSEAVLKMPQMQTEVIQGKKIVIFRGEGGRELLADTLRQRGAIVNYMNVYRRIQPSPPKWIADTTVDVITVTSVEGLQNLFAMLEKQVTWLRHTSFVVMSERVRTEAQKYGVQAPIFVAPTASDDGLLTAILNAVTI
jgi:uroporphyrinogen-III synthase